MSRKIIGIVGATGAQGGALLRAIVKDGEFVARAITRDTVSEKAQALKKLGAEVVQADVNNKDSMVKAVEGCYGMFCVTFLDHSSADKEKQQANIMAEAARKNGIKHVIWSTLDDTRKFIPLESKTMPTLMGKYKVPHFDAKAEADEYFADLPATYMMASFYWDNYFSMIKKGPDGKLYATIPMGKKAMPGIGTEDIGKCALGIFKRPDEYIGKRVGIAGEHITMADTVKQMSKALGKEVLYNEVSFDAFRSFGFPGADDLGNMFQFYHDCDVTFRASRSVEESRKLNPELMNFEQWVEKNKDKIKTEN